MLLKSCIVSQHLNYNLIEFEFDELEEPLDHLTLNLYRSESHGLANSTTDFTIVNSGITLNETQIADTSVEGLMDPQRVWNYKLTLVNNLDNTEILLTPESVYIKSKPTSFITKAILRKKALSINKKVGRNFILLKKKTWGTRCPDSWDSTLFRNTDSNCETCFGTGWVGGYFTPIEFKGMVNAAPKYNQIQMFGEWKPSDEMLLTLNYPILHPRDIIIDDENLRWIVIQVRMIKHLGYLIEQQAQLGLIATDDFIYNLNVN